MMTAIIIIAVYVVGIPVWMIVEKKVNPYKEGDYYFDEIYGPQLIDEEIHRDDVITRALLWPFVGSAFIILLFPIGLFYCSTKLYDYINRKRRR